MMRSLAGSPAMRIARLPVSLGRISMLVGDLSPSGLAR
jgi:hypothetical protein